MEASNDGKRTRTWRGRSMNGCLICRQRRVKCDERRPTCNNCAKGGRACDYQQSSSASDTETNHSSASASPILNTICVSPRRGSHQEGETFHKFLNRFAPLFGGFFDTGFWVRSVPSAAQSHEPVFKSTLAVAILYEQTRGGELQTTGDFERHHRAQLEWRESNNNNNNLIRQENPNIPLMLLSSVLYLFVAIRELPAEDLAALAMTAFADVYAARSVLWNCKDPTVLASLSMLVDISIITTIDCAQIPRAHRLCCIVLAIKISSDCQQASELYQLKFELASITYDLTDLVTDNEMQESDLNNDLNLQERLANWHNAFAALRAKSMLNMSIMLSLTRLNSLYLVALVRAEIITSPEPDRGVIEGALNGMLDLLEDLMHLFSASDRAVPPYALEMGFVAGCLVCCWHWRSQMVLERCIRILTAFPPSSKVQNHFIDTALNYLHIVVNTPYNQATELEMYLFGRKPPRSLLMWQQQRCSNYLLEVSRSVPMIKQES